MNLYGVPDSRIVPSAPRQPRLLISVDSEVPPRNISGTGHHQTQSVPMLVETERTGGIIPSGQVTQFRRLHSGVCAHGILIIAMGGRERGREGRRRFTVMENVTDIIIIKTSATLRDVKSCACQGAILSVCVCVCE